MVVDMWWTRYLFPFQDLLTPLWMNLVKNRQRRQEKLYKMWFFTKPTAQIWKEPTGKVSVQGVKSHPSFCKRVRNRPTYPMSPWRKLSLNKIWNSSLKLVEFVKKKANWFKYVLIKSIIFFTKKKQMIWQVYLF